MISIKWHSTNEMITVVSSNPNLLFEMVSSLSTSLKILPFLVILAIIKFQSVDGWEMDLQKVELKSPERVPGLYNVPMMRVVKVNRTAYVLNIDFELETDFDDTYSLKVDIFHSRLGNTDFTKSPAKFDKESLCSILKKFYDAKYWPDVLAASNLPKDYTCPLPKGKYWLKNFQPDPKKITPYAPEGLWRCDVILVDKTDKEVLTVEGTARIENGKTFG